MNPTKIEWCDYTWNPKTGCLHGCGYCYARSIAKRFGTRKNAYWDISQGVIYHRNGIDMPVLQSPVMFLAESEDGDGCSGFPIGVNPYPVGFKPTFHRYRLDEPTKLKKPSNIFVVSMGDLFGDWVPDSWIQEVFKACEAAPQHRYLFLTKNPKRYNKIGLPVGENFLYGSSVTTMSDVFVMKNENSKCNYFLSIEPILEQMFLAVYFLENIDWVIIGTETGNRKDKVIPKLEWIQNIVEQCQAANVPVFMKNSLAGIWSEPLTQEFPWARG